MDHNDLSVIKSQYTTKRQFKNQWLWVFVAGLGITAVCLELFLSDSSGLFWKNTQSPGIVAPPSTEVHRASRELALPTRIVNAPAPVASTPASKPKKDKVDPNAPQWHSITINKGDNLYRLFNRWNIDSKQLGDILQNTKARKVLSDLVPGNQLSILLGPQQQVEKLLYEIDETNVIEIVRTAQGFKATRHQQTPIIHLKKSEGTIKTSLFSAGKRAQLPQNVTTQLEKIFAWDINFAKSVRPGDKFKVLYQEQYIGGQKIGTGDIVAAEFDNNGKIYQAIRYTFPDGTSRYYTPNGHSLQKAFLRAPVRYTHVSSRFSKSRYHPILHKYRAHEGVDLAAPYGRQIHATSDGRIIFMGRKGGYGNTIVLSHGHKITTLYAHMSRFKRHLHAGQRVNEGEVIGYVGATGLATGPHVHYEYRINGRHYDPLKIKLPNAQSLPKKYRPEFKTEANQLLAQLNIGQNIQVAQNQLANLNEQIKVN